MSYDSVERRYAFRGGDILLSGADSGGKATAAWLPALEGLVAARRLYPAAGLACEAIRLPGEIADAEALAAGFRLLPFRAALNELSEDEAGRAAKGLSLLHWLEISQFCGACGSSLSDDGREGYTVGARRCPSCGRVFYPRVSPAVIVLVRRGGRMLLAHNASFPEGRFGLIAGFVEPGESLEEAARRELLEEVSVEVGQLRYRSSQPWPFPDSLMVAFEADWLSGEGRPDGVEITESRWCGPDELPSIPPKGSVARRLIDDFLVSACGRPRGPANS